MSPLLEPLELPQYELQLSAIWIERQYGAARMRVAAKRLLGMLGTGFRHGESAIFDPGA
jgi:hypothetical protein